MRMMMHSSQVQLTRDGRTLVVAEPDAVTLVALRDGECRRLRPSAEPLLEARPLPPEPADLLTSVVRPPEPRPPEPRPPEPRPPEPRPPRIADALEPRPCRPRLPLAAELAKLDREIQSITRWALRAIFEPGDRHRLGHDNEDLTATRDAQCERERKRHEASIPRRC
jgi:hypothetical protein